jgi:hypothetical protein
MLPPVKRTRKMPALLPMLQARRWQRLTFPPMPWAALCMGSGLPLPAAITQMMVLSGNATGSYNACVAWPGYDSGRTGIPIIRFAPWISSTSADTGITTFTVLMSMLARAFV